MRSNATKSSHLRMEFGGMEKGLFGVVKELDSDERQSGTPARAQALDTASNHRRNPHCLTPTRSPSRCCVAMGSFSFFHAAHGASHAVVRCSTSPFHTCRPPHGCRVENNGDRSVVLKFHAHRGAKLAARDWDSLSHESHLNFFALHAGDGRFFCTTPSGSIAARQIRKQCELTHEQD